MCMAEPQLQTQLSSRMRKTALSPSQFQVQGLNGHGLSSPPGYQRAPAPLPNLVCGMRRTSDGGHQ